MNLLAVLQVVMVLFAILFFLHFLILFHEISVFIFYDYDIKRNRSVVYFRPLR